MSNRVKQAWKIISSSPGLLSGIRTLWFVYKEVWLFDILRPGVRTGFQSKSTSLLEKYMWYSPVETKTCRSMVSFARDWIRSYYEYSSSDAVPVFVDLGSGAGKANLIALELGFPISVGMEIDQDLVSLSNQNFSVLRKLRRSIGIGFATKGDVTVPNDLRRLRDEVDRKIAGKPLWVIFNKNSYGSLELEASVDALNELIGDYVYLYQNPVHERSLLKKNFFVHRRVVDSRLRKNRDWILATPGPR